MNAQSARNKINLINEYLVHDEIHIAAITETWFTTDDEQLTHDITPQGYEITHTTRNGRRGGGVAIIAQSRFKPTAYPTQIFDSSKRFLLSYRQRNLPSS